MIRKALSGLSEVEDPQAMELVNAYAEDPDYAEEAAVAFAAHSPEPVHRDGVTQ